MITLPQNNLEVKNWLYPKFSIEDTNQLAKSLEIDPLLAAVLVQRGMPTKADAERFFHPDIQALHDPFLMKDMDLAVRRLNRAIMSEERILLYGDYDVDGTTSVALMYAFLRNFYNNIDYYLPDRDKEGYGVSMAGVEYAHETGCTLVIAMDCGIKAIEEVKKAASYGMDFIICDHHLPEGGLPNSVANLDPKRDDCPYPFKDLSGCGIAFKLAQAYALYNTTPAEELVGLLDFVALSIACDIVPMVGENRILAYHGLEKLNRSPRLGIWALINKSGRPYPLQINDLVFGLGPLINSAGRLGDARESVRLMLSVDRNSAIEAAGQLITRNRQRQAMDTTATSAARLRVKEIIAQNNPKTIVLFDASWHKGVVGITASRISEDYHKPTVILTESDGMAVGSARSVPGFDLYAAMQSCEDLFHSYGGHSHAVGLQMAIEHVPVFTERLEAWAQKNMSVASEQPSVEVVGDILLGQITPAFFKDLNRFCPFGPENMNPVFVAKGVRDTGKSRRLENNHVRFSLIQGTTTISAIGFGMADQFDLVKHRPFDIAFNLREEQWRGNTVISLQVKDLH
jgi:single-stranded-DNA-specific exonuclease